MTTDEGINYGSMVTPPSTFNMDFAPGKGSSPPLFPTGPKKVDDPKEDSNQEETKYTVELIDISDNVVSRKSIDLITEEVVETKTYYSHISKSEEAIKGLQSESAEVTKEEDSKSKSVEDEPEKDTVKELFSITCTNPDVPLEDKNLAKTNLSLPSASPSLSVSSYSSSAESVSSHSSTKKKKKKRYCQACDIKFRRSHELETHLKTDHVKLPDVDVVRLDENIDSEYKEFLDREKTRVVPGELEGSDQSSINGEGNGQQESTGLKLKLKLSGPQNFQVVPPSVPQSKSPENKPHKKLIRILPASEIKASPPSTPSVQPLDAMVAMSEMHVKQQNELDASKYFECPTLDGLDQYAEEVSNEATADLLKKLLEGQQQVPQETNTDWSANTNEFISIDRLAHMCTVCHSNFPDAVRLYEHKRITGHDFQPAMKPPPSPVPAVSPHMGMQEQYNRARLPFPPNMTPAPGVYCPPMHNSMNGVQMKNNFSPFPQRYPVLSPSPGTSPVPSPGAVFVPTQPGVRRPPPLYRAPSPQCGQPINMAPFAEMNPEMYIPSSNGNVTTIMNGSPPFSTSPQQQQQIAQMQSRQPIFLKARLQRALRPLAPAMPGGSPNSTPSPPIIMTQQTATRPRFLGPPYDSPPKKKIKTEIDDCEVIATQPRTDGIPIIQSVAGGVNEADLMNAQSDPKGDPTGLKQKQPDANKNPKDVANILANRGITVTHKSKLSPLNEGMQKSSAQEAVQKLQLNNSVSIIQKKKLIEPGDDIPKIIRPGESAFIPCPVADCEEKFLTQEGLNRHTQRGHRVGKPSLKAFRCRHCPALFSTQEGLQEHQKKNHRLQRTSADELGIPIVDLRNEQTKQKLAQLGIINYIPLSKQQPNGFYGFPIVSVQGASNPNVCNILGLGSNSLLSLGPIKQIPIRRNDL